jgi:hypothetical protein
MAMEHAVEKTMFIPVPVELKAKIVSNAIGYAKDMNEAVAFVQVCKRVNPELKLEYIVENEQNSAHLVKTLHKKFKIPKIQVRYMLHTDETQKQLLKKMGVIIKYAFLNYVTLLREPLLRTRVYARTSLPLLALERAHMVLKQNRKNDVQFWENNEDIIPRYSIVTQSNTIDVSVDVHYSNSKAPELTNIAAFLLYLAEHGNEVIAKNAVLKEGETFFSLLISQVDGVFYPSPSRESSLYKETCARIHLIKS